jgi:hypothetical protein
MPARWLCRKSSPKTAAMYNRRQRVTVGRRVVIKLKGGHFEREVILWGVHWFVAYPISYRQPRE